MAALLSQALAPVLRALGARGKKSGAEEPSPVVAAESAQTAAPGASRRGLPEIDYPVPLVVKNTFIDADISGRPELEGFYLERGFKSTPAHTLEGPAAPWEAPGCQPAAPDGSSSCRSTCAGSSSVRSSVDESPSCESEVSPLDEADPCSPLDQTLAGSSSGARKLASLPDFEYPARLIVKNTFIDTNIGRSLSIDDFYEERQLRSCPGSALYALPEAEAAEGASPAGAAPADAEEGEGGSCPLAASTPECSPRMPYCQPADLSFGLPLPPVEPPAFPAQLSFLYADPSWQAHDPSDAPPPPACSPEAPVLLKLSDALQVAVLVPPELPSVGSGEHALGTCKPCAHAYSAKGCKSGVQCKFCHICPPGELKRQQKVKRWAQRKGFGA